jgi:hypothetical protein
MGQFRNLVLAALLGCLATPMPAHATVIFRFEGEPIAGLYSISADLGFRDEVLEREGYIPVEDLEWAKTTYQYSNSEFDVSVPFGPVNRVTMGNGMEFPFVTFPNLTDRAGTLVRWGDVRIDDNELVFGLASEGRVETALFVIEPCDEVDEGVYYCYPNDDYYISTVDGET